MKDDELIRSCGMAEKTLVLAARSKCYYVVIQPPSAFMLIGHVVHAEVSTHIQHFPR